MAVRFSVRCMVGRCKLGWRSLHKMAVYDYKYEQAVKELNQLQCNKMLSRQEKLDGLGLTVMRQFLQRVEVSQTDLKKLNVIHVSGTKGKGSTCAFVESILRHHGMRTGFYSSPHLLEVRERIRINGKPISTQLFTKYFWEVYEHLDRTKDSYEVKIPSYFYFLTVMAYYVFKHENITATIMEVGIGGAFDCTNVIENPVVCGVSSLGIDHTTMLGNTLSSIAWQKAGIFKKGVPAFTVPQPKEGMDVLVQRAQELGTKLNVTPDFTDYVCADIPKLGLSGEHQKLNASLALQLANAWLNSFKNVSSGMCQPFSLNTAFIQGLASCQWNGRAQILKFNNITFYMDGAHTMRSLGCAVKWFTEASTNEQMELNKTCDRVLAFNVTNERDAYNLLSVLLPCNFKHAIFTSNIATLISSDFNDQTNFKNPVEDRLIRVLANRDDWLELCSAQNYPMERCCTNTFPAIADAVCWLAEKRDDKLFRRSLEMMVEYPTSSLGCAQTHLQVLVTGSLHLIGGYLRILQPDINN
ncbi:folylpolyglutamate synthase, mitochondrial-like [Clavelina lepadiformis]|uniref:folylpolyglutamate synthase, mitochondrial-like n=1 Tax=Clavelina lepadiformis TaxID=159417 RepID=UPI004041C8CA